MDDGTASVAVINAIRSIVGSGGAVNEHSFRLSIVSMQSALARVPHHHQPGNTRNLCACTQLLLLLLLLLMLLLHLHRGTGVN